MELTAEILGLLFLLAFAAGFIDAVAGGGGLLTIPTLMFVGLPPVQALGTNKFQACFGSFSASLHFVRQRQVSLLRLRWMIAAVALGASFGAWLIQQLDSGFLLLLMPLALIAIALYSFFSKDLGLAETAPRISDRRFSATAASGIGAYDGFFGPGTGTFFAMAFVKLLGMDFVRATAAAKVLNFTSNITSLLVFLMAGQVAFVIGLVMAVGQVFGGMLGAKTVIRRGAGFIRLVTVLVCVAMSLSLILKA